MAIIEVEQVRKTFTRRQRNGLRRAKVDVTAVDGVSFTIDAGDIVGYIGPNGAGKSTTIKMLAGILSPTSGSVRVAGLNPTRDRMRLARQMGAVFGQRSTLWWDLPLMDSFAVLRRVYGVEPSRHYDNLGTFIERLELGPLLDTPVRQLSLGQRMRGELTAALLHDPDVVYLDEPTIGLDVVSKSAVREFLGEVNRERGTTILLTTHDLHDIERLCPRVILIDEGRIVHDGPIAALRSATSRQRTIVVDLEAPVDAVAVSGTHVLRTDGPRQWLALEDDASLPSVVAAVVSRGDLVDLSIQEPSIEEVIGDLYRAGTSPG